MRTVQTLGRHREKHFFMAEIAEKFSSRFGLDALKFVSTPLSRELSLRGINTRVVQSGTVQTGDVVKKYNAS